VRKQESALVLYTGDAGIWESDEVFVEFITGRHDAFVVEDADLLPAPRADGNQTLHRFLNIADGIVRAHGRKVIFSPNLPNVRDIDPALVRPGRCFARVFVRNLKALEMRRLVNRLCEGDAERVAAVVDRLNRDGKKGWSVAEVSAAVRSIDDRRESEEDREIRADAA